MGTLVLCRCTRSLFCSYRLSVGPVERLGFVVFKPVDMLEDKGVPTAGARERNGQVPVGLVGQTIQALPYQSYVGLKLEQKNAWSQFAVTLLKLHKLVIFMESLKLLPPDGIF